MWQRADRYLKKAQVAAQIAHVWAAPAHSSSKPCLFILLTHDSVVWNTPDFCYMCLTPQPAVSRNQDGTEQGVPSTSLLLLKISYCDTSHVVWFFCLLLHWLMCKIRLMFKQCQVVRGRKHSATVTRDMTRGKINHLLRSEKLNTKRITMCLNSLTVCERLSADPKICFINSS